MKELSNTNFKVGDEIVIQDRWGSGYSNGVVDKITPSGLVKAHTYSNPKAVYTFRLDGTLRTSDPYVKTYLLPYTDELKAKIVIQDTFKRLREVNTLTLLEAKKISEVLDERDARIQAKNK